MTKDTDNRCSEVIEGSLCFSLFLPCLRIITKSIKSAPNTYNTDALHTQNNSNPYVLHLARSTSCYHVWSFLWQLSAFHQHKTVPGKNQSTIISSLLNNSSSILNTMNSLSKMHKYDRLTERPCYRKKCKLALEWFHLTTLLLLL